jgi:antitoxin ParD1/3/4
MQRLKARLVIASSSIECFKIPFYQMRLWCIITPYIDKDRDFMTRQSITLTPPNDEWLKAQLASEEYNSKSEIVNDLIRKARREEQEMQYIRTQLIAAEQSGFTAQPPDEMPAEFKARLRHDTI